MIEGDIKNLEKLLATLSFGITEAIKAGIMTINEAQRILYSPYMMGKLSKIGASEDIIDLMHAGTEIEDIEDLIPDQLYAELSKMSDAASNIMEDIPSTDWEKPIWHRELFDRLYNSKLH